jgi:site-specific recombinase XerD
MASNERFIQISESDTFIQSMKNDNTWKKTKRDVKLFSEWLHKENEDRLIEDIEKDKLDQYLARFFLSVRNRKGEEYEPDTLKSFQASVSRYLMEKTKTNIMLDREFTHSRDVLSAK